MRMTCRGIIAMALAIAPAAFADEAKPAKTDFTELATPPRYAEAVSLAMDWGHSLWLDDEASATATDILTARHLLQGHEHATGWITTPYDDKGTWRTFFTEDDHGTPKDFVDILIDMSSGKARPVGIDVHSPSIDLTREERLLVDARDRAMKEPGQRCTERYNQATWLVHHPGGWYVMVDLMPARTQVDAYPVGGFHTYNYGRLDKGTPLHFQQTNACLNATRPRDADVQGIWVQHLTGPTPTKFHVFMSLSFGQTLYVVTASNKLLWRVDHGTIRLLDSSKGQAHDLVSQFSD
jgi:hypothetical protein